MDHGYFKDRISAYYDNNLKPEERVVVEEHLKECEECRKLLEEFIKLDRLVEEHSQLGGEEYWEESARKIEKSLGFEEETKATAVAPLRQFGLTWKLVAVAASVAVLTIVGLHRDEIWHEEKLEPIPAYIPETETPAEKGAGKVSDKMEEAKPAAVDEDRTDLEVRETEKELEPSRGSKGIVNDKSETQDEETSTVTPVEPEPFDVGKGPSPTTVEKRRVDAERQAQKGSVETDLAQPAVTEKLLQQSMEKKDEKALIEQIPPENETESESLARLREQKDSLARLMVAEGRWQDKTNLVQPLTGEESKKKVKRTPADIENELIQTCYKIALLTDDSEEFEAVRGIIRKVAEDENSPNRELARSYLKLLSDRN